jgi:endonuclease-3
MDCETFKDVVGRLGEEHDAEPRSTEPWEEIVMTVLSQNTADENRDRAYDALVKEYETPEEILNAPEDRLQDLIAPAGLASSKASYLKNAARHIVEKRGGETEWIRDEPPEDVHDELTGIKGVGHKTADVILLFAADAEYCPVDTHVDRVTGRLGVAPEMSPVKTREKLLEFREDCGINLREAHVALIAHGRTTCHARSPECGDCVVEDMCEKHGVEE